MSYLRKKAESQRKQKEETEKWKQLSPEERTTRLKTEYNDQLNRYFSKKNMDISGRRETFERFAFRSEDFIDNFVLENLILGKDASKKSKMCVSELWSQQLRRQLLTASKMQKQRTLLKFFSLECMEAEKLQASKANMTMDKLKSKKLGKSIKVLGDIKHIDEYDVGTVRIIKMRKTKLQGKKKQEEKPGDQRIHTEPASQSKEAPLSERTKTMESSSAFERFKEKKKGIKEIKKLTERSNFLIHTAQWMNFQNQKDKLELQKSQKSLSYSQKLEKFSHSNLNPE